MACQDCKKKAQIKLNWMMVLGIELIITSLYGNYLVFTKLIYWVNSLF
jgi:hypothetical protein